MGSRSRPGSAGPRPRVVVVAGRRSSRVDEPWWPLLDRVREQQRFDRVWHGARGGADEGVAAWATARGLPVVEFPAPVALYEAAGQSAARAEARRNDDMLRAWGGYRARGGSIVACARAGGFVDLVLVLGFDEVARDLVDRARRWRTLPVIELSAPRRRWRVLGPRMDSELTTLGDVVVGADLPLRWTVGRTRAQLRGLFAHRGWRARGLGVPRYQDHDEGPHS